jgi:hypothetical protein
MNAEEEKVRARQASALLEDTLLIQAFSDLEDHYTSVWKGSKPSQNEVREEAHSALFALNQFRQQLQNYIETGKLATAALGETGERWTSTIGRGTDNHSRS